MASLTPHKGSFGDDVVHVLDHLHVGVEIEAAVLIEYPEAGIVAHEGILLRLVCLSGIGNDVHIEVVLVPLLYLIVGKILPPRRYALLRQLRQRVATEPAVMYYFGYHIDFLSL